MEEKKVVEEIRAALPDEETIAGLAELFKMFGDGTRAKILSCLQIKPLCVYEIAEVLDMSMSAVSHQLRVLRSGKLVKGKKEGNLFSRRRPHYQNAGIRHFPRQRGQIKKGQGLPCFLTAYS